MARLVRAAHDFRLSRGSAAVAALLSFCSPPSGGGIRSGGNARGWAVAGVLVAVCACGEARAGVWPLDAGDTLAIVKYERAEAGDAWDIDGNRYDWIERTDETASLYIEHGLTERITLQGKLAWSRGVEAGVPYAGRGPAELGLRLAVLDSGPTVVSVYAGALVAGDGRNVGYAPPGEGGVDYELRLLAGRSFTVQGRPAFLEAQVARLERAELFDETRLDLTLGYEPSPRWLLLVQSYGGLTEAEPAWLKLEASAVRRFGDWSLQAGWRASVAGRAGPVEDGPVVAVWRRF